MRDEKTIFALVNDVAVKDAGIRAVYMNGSRANPNVTKDALCDYDIVFMVDNTVDYYENDAFIRQFGEILYMQQPDEMDKMLGLEVDFSEKYTWLVIFEDGVRMDITIVNLESKLVYSEKACVVLLDKDGRLADVPEATDSDWWVKRFSEQEYIAACNEFWWCLNNVAKGIRRYEIPYAQDMLNKVVRPQLVKMLEWKVGILTDYTVSVGKSGKYLNKWLREDEYELFLETYCGAVAGEMWRSVLVMCRLFEDTARFVAANLGYEYNSEEAEAAMKYLHFVREMDRI